jgi:uncharacterized membrane protein YeaQ/YmgE (transglycosylase-associated protein family)
MSLLIFNGSHLADGLAHRIYLVHTEHLNHESVTKKHKSLLGIFYSSRRSDRRPINNQLRKGPWLQRSFTVLTFTSQLLRIHPSSFATARPARTTRANPFLVRESLANCETPCHTRQLSVGKRRGKIMIHLIWYIVVGLIAGIIAKSVMHVHMTIFWTIVLGIIGSIIGGAVTHIFSHPTNERFHPAGIIFSTLGAILVLYLCLKLHIRFPRVL